MLSSLSFDDLFAILLRVSPSTIENVCVVSSAFVEVCASESFWRQKVEIDFPGMGSWKPTEITYREQYIDLLYADQIGRAASDGRADIVIYNKGDNLIDVLAASTSMENVKRLIEEGYPITNEAATLATYKGDIERLELFESIGLLPTPVHHVAALGRLETIAWMHERGLPVSTWAFLNAAVQHNRPELLNWYLDRGVFPDARSMIALDSIEMVKTFLDRGVRPTPLTAWTIVAAMIEKDKREDLVEFISLLTPREKKQLFFYADDALPFLKRLMAAEDPWSVEWSDEE